jgi:hypothetical protein
MADEQWWESDLRAAGGFSSPKVPPVTSSLPEEEEEEENWWERDLQSSTKATDVGRAYSGLGSYERPVEAPQESIFRSFADPFLNIGAGINDVVKGFTDAFGADNAVSQNLAKNSEWYRSLLSAGAKEDAEEIGRIMQEAEGQGVLAEIGAGLKALSVAPIDLVSQGIGSLIPFIATAGVGKAIGLSRAGVAVLQGVQGGAVGGGIVKGEIYDAVKEQLINSGVDEAKAEKAANEAQAYNGKNLDQILLGVGLGVAASSTGAEGAIRSLITRKAGQEAAKEVTEQEIQKILRTGFVRGAAQGLAVETTTEALQGGQERLAANVAVGREGFDVEPMRGVFGQATLEGALGGILGGGAGGISAKVEQLGMRESVALRDAAKAAQEAKQNNAPASAAVVEEQINQTLEETPDQRVARLQQEAAEAAAIDLEEEGEGGVEPTVPVTPPVVPTPEGAVAPVEPVVPAAGAVEPTAVATPTEPVAPTEPAAAEPVPAVAPRPAVDVEALSPNAKRANRILNNAGVDPETAAFVAQQYQDEIADLGGEELRAFVLDKFEENGGVIPAQMRYSEDQEYYEMAFGIGPEEAATLVENAKGQNTQMAQAELEQNKQWRRKDEQITEAQQGVAVAQPEAQAVPLPAGEVPPSPAIEGRRVPLAAPEAAVTPEVTPETPNLEPLRRVARAEQTEEDVSGLVGQGLVELYNGQPVITQAGLETLPEAERPRLNPEARKIQIDTGSNEVVAEAIAKGLRIGVDQVGTGVRMPAGWILVEDIYVPPKPKERITPSDIETAVIPEEAGDVFANLVRRKQEVQPVVLQKPVGSQFQNPEEFRSAFDLRGQGHTRFAIRLDLMQEDGAITEDGKNLILATIWDNNTNDEFLANMEMGSARKNVKSYGYGGRTRQTVEGGRVEQKPLLELIRQTRRGGAEADKRTALTLNTFWHEYGHAGYYSLLDAKQKKAVDDAYNKTTRAGRRAFFAEGKSDAENTPWFSKYYAKNESEWFAQSFAEYVITQKSDQKNLVPIFEQLLDKIKAVFTKLFNRKEQVNLNDIFDFIIRGEAYGQTPTWQGFIMSTKPAVYGTPRGQAISPEFTKRLLEREGVSPQDERRQQIIDGISLRFRRSKNEYGNNEFKTEYDFGGRSPIVDKISFSLEQFDDSTVAMSYLPSKGGKYVNIKLGELEQQFKGRAAAERAIKRAIAEIEMDERVGGAEEAAPITDVWQAPEQEITSAKTSINEKKLPAVFNKVKEWVSGTVNADIGGGRFDNATDWLRDRGVTNLIIDWFNRDRAFNEANINRVRGGQADTATASNVLNVIQESDARDLVIRQAADAIKEDGVAYFYIYEGDKSGTGKQTTSGWQENRRTQDYIDEISQHFGDVTRQGQMIVARNPIKEGAEPTMAPEIPETIPTFSEGSPEASTLSTMAASMAKVDAASEAKGPTTYKISEIASIWMDQGGDTRRLQDLISENTNLTPANAKKVANAIAKQYDIQNSIAEAQIETAEGISLEGLPEGVSIPKEADPKRTKTVIQRLIDVTTGVRVPPVKITATERSLLNSQIRLKAAAFRDAKKAQQETASEVVEIIKAMELRGPVRPKQAQALAKRAAKVIWTSEKSMESFIAYAEKVVANTNYDADLREAKAAQKRALELSKRSTVASPQQEVLANIAKIGVNMLENPREFADVVNYYMRGFKPVVSPDYVVVPDEEMTSYLSQAEDIVEEARAEFDRIVTQRLSEKYGVSPDKIQSILDAQDIERALTQYAKREVAEAILNEKANEVLAGLRAYDQSSLRGDQRKIIDSILKLDPSLLSSQERQQFVRTGNNIIFNNQTHGAEFFAVTAKGQQMAKEAASNEDLIAKNNAWVNILPSLRSRTLQKTWRNWALELQSVADTFRNAFGKGAMAKVYRMMGMYDLDRGFTSAANAVNKIQEEISAFYNGLEKKYKASARSQDGILAEGVVGFLIQKVPEKGEVESLAQRRNLIQQDIRNRRNDPDRVEMADRIERILQQLDGESVSDIMANLKRDYRANYESVTWLKDTLFPKYKEFLKRFDENFNDQANNYDNPDYLPIGFIRAGVSLAITPENEAMYYEHVSLRPKQSSYTIKRADYTQLPTDKTTNKPKEIEFNLRRNAFDSLSDQVSKAYTSPAWQQIFAFMKTPESEKLFGGAANKEFFIERLNRLRLSRMRRGSMSSGYIEKTADVLSVFARKIGTGIALGGAYQPFKQAPDQLIAAIGTTGRADLMAENMAPSALKAAKVLLDKFSIGRRGDASSGYKYINQMEGAQNKIERYLSESRWDAAKEQAGKVADVWLLALKKTDYVFAAGAWMTYYRAQLAKDGVKFQGWEQESQLLETDTARQDAAAYAEQMTDIYQGSSDPTKMATFVQSGKSGWENLFKAIFVPFNSFAVQQRMRIYSDARDALLKSGEDKAIGAFGLASTIGGLVAFHSVRRFALPALTGLGVSMLYAAFGVDMEEPDEEKKAEDFAKRWRQFLGEFTANLLVGGSGQIVEAATIDSFNYAAYLIAMQTEDETVLGDDGEIISFSKYAKERSPFWRYRSFDNAMSLGMFDIGLDQGKKAILETKTLMTPEEMENFTTEEQSLLYFAAISDWLYLMRLNDADFARMVDRARREIKARSKETEKELKRIRSGR